MFFAASDKRLVLFWPKLYFISNSNFIGYTNNDACIVQCVRACHYISGDNISDTYCRDLKLQEWSLRILVCTPIV